MMHKMLSNYIKHTQMTFQHQPHPLRAIKKGNLAGNLSTAYKQNNTIVVKQGFNQVEGKVVYSVETLERYVFVVESSYK